MTAKKSFWGQLWTVVNGTRKIIVNLVFFFVLGFFLIFLTKEEDPIEVPDNSVLVLNLTGTLVEELTYVDPFTKFIDEMDGNGSDNPEVLLSDVLDAIEQAKSDERIGALELDLTNLRGGGLNKMQTIGAALEDFKTSGKPVITAGDYYTQGQYFLASYADDVYLNPLGGVMLEGYGGYQLYFKEMLDKLKVSTHIFKVGDFKSAVEPYSRTNMSEEAKEANAEIYGDLWSVYLKEITNRRELDPRVTSGSIEDWNALLNEYDHDMGKMAVGVGLVDALRTREQLRTDMINLAGLDEETDTYNQIAFDSYLEANFEPSFREPEGDAVAIVQARGVIVDGSQNAGMIGGDSTAALLRQARLNDDVKAVVLRIDSPGGSAFASEIIRQEILELQQAGIPVVSSMSSVAASGGYWIAASTDQIWAAPTTITGSIGVFGMFTTFENSLAHIGVYTDGVKTTDLPSVNVTRPLSDGAKSMVQGSIERIYQDFLQLVAEGREMSVDAVHEVAQGRVWSGSKAQKLGLVDELGGLEEAISAAAELAGLSDYRIAPMTRELTGADAFMQELFGQALTWFPSPRLDNTPSVIRTETMRLVNEIERLEDFNDPNGAYALCELCPLQ